MDKQDQDQRGRPIERGTAKDKLLNWDRIAAAAQPDYATCTSSEIDYPADEIEWMMAVDRYKREHERPFPSLHELYGILMALGYVKLPPVGTGIKRK